MVRHRHRHKTDRQTENHTETQSGPLLRVGDARLLNLSCGEEVGTPEGDDGGSHMAAAGVGSCPAPAGAVVGHQTLSLEPRQRWLAPLGPTEMSSVMVCQFDLSLQLLWVGGRSSLMV